MARPRSPRTPSTPLLAKVIEPPTREGEKFIKCPFVVMIDTRESLPYTFESIRANASQGGHRIQVQRIRLCMPTGDYSIFGLPQISIERKSLSDLFGSVGRRDNFIERLHRMSEQARADVVVEAEISEIMKNPPPYSKIHPRSLMASINAWREDFPTVHWWFLPGRAAAETWTYRRLDMYYRKHKGEVEDAVYRSADGRKVPSRPIEGVGEGAAQHEEGDAGDCPEGIPDGPPIACPNCSHHFPYPYPQPTPGESAAPTATVTDGPIAIPHVIAPASAEHAPRTDDMQVARP